MDQCEVTDEEITDAVEACQTAIKGSFGKCDNVEGVLRFALSNVFSQKFAKAFIKSHSISDWNALCHSLSSDGWMVWYEKPSIKTEQPTP